MKKKSKQLIEARKFKVDNPELSFTKVANMFSVDRHTLSKLSIEELDYYNITSENDPDNLYYFSPEELELVNYYINNSEVNFKKLKEKYPNSCPESSSTLKRWCEILGKEYQSRCFTKHKNLNKRYFENISTEEQAYWLGFILADGYINEEHNVLTFSLGEKDKEHLKKFLKAINASEEEIETMILNSFGGAYTRDNPTVRLTICGKDLVADLKKYGIKQAKSEKEVPYIFKEELLEKAYVRGIFDGDGYIRSTQLGFGFVGSYDVMSYIKDFCLRYFGKTFEKVNICSYGTIFRFATNGKNSTKIFLDYLYSDASIYLDRKYDLYKKMYCRE